MTFVSTLGQAIDQIERLKVTQLQLSTLQTQVATGKKTQLFKGLGTDVIASERAREGLAKYGAYNNNIDIADRRIKMMTSSLTEIQNQAKDVLNAIEIQTQQGEYEIGSVSDLARNAAKFIRDLINTQDGDRYLFGGSETTTQPMTDTGSMQTYMIKQLNDWVNGSTNTDQLISSYSDDTQLTDTIVGYSATLSSGNAKNVNVRVDDNSEIDYTVLANTPGIRDIVAAVNMLGNVDQVIDQVSNDPNNPAPPGTTTAPGADKQEQNNNFYKFFNNLAAMMNRALDKVDSKLYSLSQSQAQIAKIKDAHTLDQSILKDTVSSVEDVDMNEVAVKLNALQNQLEASYRVTASISSLSLVNFLR